MDWNQIYTEEHYRELARVLESPKLFTKEACDFELYDYQEQYVDFIHEHPKAIALKARQTGVSNTTMAYLYWYACTHPNQNIIIAGHTQHASTELVEKIRSWLIEGPSFFTSLVVATTKSELRFDNGSRIIARAPTGNSFRGMTCNIVYLDDFAYVRADVQKDLLDCMLPCLSAVRGKIIISTGPNTKLDEVYRIWETDQKFQKLLLPYTCNRDEHFANQQKATLGHDQFLQEYECQFIK